MTESAERRMPRRARLVEALAWSGLALALAAFVLESTLAEEAWISTIVLQAPQVPFLILPALALIFSWRARSRRAALLGAVGLAIGVHLCAPVVRWPFGDPPAAPNRVKVLTFNIEHAFGSPDEIAALLRVEAPDLVGLQESGFMEEGEPRAKTIRSALPGYHWRYRGGLAVGSRWPIRRERIVDFGTKTHRCALFAEIDAPGSRPIAFGTSHLLPLQGGDPLLNSPSGIPDRVRRFGRDRIRQARMMAEQGTRYGEGYDVILCGDFNGPPRGKVYDTFEAEFEDAFRSRGFGLGWTMPDWLPQRRIDYVFVRRGPGKGGAASRIVSARVLPDSGSDHLPLVVEISR